MIPTVGFVALIALGSAWYTVYVLFGQTESFRVWGIGLIGVSVIFSFRKNIPVYVGSFQAQPLSGWRKAYVVLPMSIIGILVTLFPHQVACTVALKHYVCT